MKSKMINYYRKFTLIAALLFISNLGFGQSNEIKIKFIGNCGLYMTDGETNFYIDFPYKSGAYNYMEYDPAEIDSIKDNAVFIFTHRHADHYSKKLLKKLDGQKFDPWNVSELGKLSESIPDFGIQPFKTQHKVFGISFKHYSYLITWHGKKIYLSGDTENADTIAGVKDIDWAFVPYWIIIDANEKGLKIDADKIAVYHLYPNQKTNNLSPEKIIFLDKEGKEISISY
jgi:L-ascorbate metabolism protein UlaG (beta-lactamase superfamily)